MREVSHSYMWTIFYCLVSKVFALLKIQYQAPIKNTLQKEYLRKMRYYKNRQKSQRHIVYEHLLTKREIV